MLYDYIVLRYQFQTFGLYFISLKRMFIFYYLNYKVLLECQYITMVKFVCMLMCKITMVIIDG